MNFDGKVVVITGAGKGIGKMIARKYAEKLSEVILVDIDNKSGNKNKDYIIENGGKAIFIEGDISLEEDCKKIINEVVLKYGKIDILINNAGISNPKNGGIFENGMESFDRIINVNLRGTFMLSKYSIPNMPHGSSIVNLSSTRAFMSEANTEAYSVSKGGISALTHSMAVSLSENGIRVNCISPGWIDTSNDENEKPEKLTELDHKQHPAGRVGIPEDIAYACLYLTSDEAGFITGTNLNIDGGMTVKMMYV